MAKVFDMQALAAAVEEAQAENARLAAENAKLRAAKGGGGTPSLKVSAKGAISIYGLQRFPVTLYPNQWEHIFAMQDKVRSFAEAHRAELKFEKAE